MGYFIFLFGIGLGYVLVRLIDMVIDDDEPRTYRSDYFTNPPPPRKEVKVKHEKPEGDFIIVNKTAQKIGEATGDISLGDVIDEE